MTRQDVLAALDLCRPGLGKVRVAAAQELLAYFPE